MWVLLRQPVEPSEDHLWGTISLVQSSRLPAHPLVLNVVLAEYRHDGDINVCATHSPYPLDFRSMRFSVGPVKLCSSNLKKKMAECLQAQNHKTDTNEALPEVGRGILE